MITCILLKFSELMGDHVAVDKIIAVGILHRDFSSEQVQQHKLIATFCRQKRVSLTTLL